MAHEFIEHLIEDHNKQRRLGEQLRQAEDPEIREELRDEYYEELYPHIIGEEASIFDYLTSAEGEPREEALKALQEHHVAKILLRELMDLEVDGDVFKAKAHVLDELNCDHIDEEEQTHFPILVRMADKEQLDELFDRYEEAEEAEED
jgi:hemerythrin superfamily protein